MIPINYHPPSRIITEPPSQTTTESTSQTTANSSRTSAESLSQKIAKSVAQRIVDSWATLDPSFSTIPESCYQTPARTSTRGTPVNCDPDPSTAIPDHEHLPASPDVQSTRPRGPMIPIAVFRHSRPTIADPDTPETSRTTTDYWNTSPTTVDYPDTSQNVAESCYRPAIETSIKNVPEDSSLDVSAAISDREHLPASPDVQSEVNDGAPSGSEPSPRIEDPCDSGLSAFPEFDEAEEIIDFYLSFESDPPSDHDNVERSDSPLSEPLIFRDQKPAHPDTPDQREELPLPRHPYPLPISRSPSSLSSTSYYSSSSRPPLSSTSHADHRDASRPTSAYSALSDTSLETPHEFDDPIDAYANSRTKDDSISLRYHQDTSLSRSIEPQSAVLASHSSSVSPSTRSPPQSPLENSRLDDPYESNDRLDAYADAHAKNNSTSLRDKASPSPDSDRFHHQLVSPTEIAISATVPRTPKFSSTAKSRFPTIRSPRHSLSSIPRRSAMFSTPLRARL